MKTNSGIERIGKPGWRAMLRYVADLRQKSTHPPRDPFPHAWEEIGPGYCYGPAFGHWDLVHAILDTAAWDSDHAKNQILNNLAAQQEDGLVPGTIYLREEEPHWNHKVGHPPVWPVAVEDHADLTGSAELIGQCYEPLVRQIGWFETHRRASGAGFYYADVLHGGWESGVDQGIRFLDAQPVPLACVDATAHVYALYTYAAKWSETVGDDPKVYQKKAAVLRDLIQNELFDVETGTFYDIWMIKDPSERRTSFEGMWPLVVGAATPEQAGRVIDENLLNPRRYFTTHPISTVAVEEPCFELRMWRGPAWNSMTYWAARGCLRYSRADAAIKLLEKALDASAAQFERSGTIWEFFHPHGGKPEDLERKPLTPYNTPCRDYLGHNPLIEMARLHDIARQRSEA
jgi:putative isomerase